MPIHPADEYIGTHASEDPEAEPRHLWHHGSDDTICGLAVIGPDDKDGPLFTSDPASATCGGCLGGCEAAGSPESYRQRREDREQEEAPRDDFDAHLGEGRAWDDIDCASLDAADRADVAHDEDASSDRVAEWEGIF